ncbi:MAG: hypothetical protein L0196_02590 [candidate division Zixibacteria bacterium]|nr:hypothetical protein [candidate division Zixibacteria bacterium]
MKKDFNNSTLFVLGAGASIGAKRYPIESSWRESVSKMPSSQHFFADLFHVGGTDSNPEHFVNMLGPMYEGTDNLIKLAWGIKKGTNWENPGDWKSINVEDVFTFLDVGERVYNKGTGYHFACTAPPNFGQAFS